MLSVMHHIQINQLVSTEETYKWLSQNCQSSWGQAEGKMAAARGR